MEKKLGKYKRLIRLQAIMQIFIGILGSASFIILATSGEMMGKWIPALVLAIIFIVLGIVGIVLGK